MARIHHHQVWNHATQYRLVSNIPAYKFQILYIIKQCKGHYETRQPNGSLQVNLCTEEHLQWRGEFADGTFTQFFEVEPTHFATWKKRAEVDKARPEAQMTSEYSQSINRPADQVLNYLKRLDKGQLWWKGNRVQA